MEQFLQTLGWLVAAAAWLYTLRTASRDERLSEDGRRIAVFAILLSPWLALAYWLPYRSDSGPFWIHIDARGSGGHDR